MKKNKTIAYMLAATLLVGGTFVGTKALFTDVEQVAGELSISTGDVNIFADTDVKWKLDRNGNEHADGSKGIEGEVGTNEGILGDGGDSFETENPLANNLKPGDILTKEITVKNNGTLKAKISVTESEDLKEELKGLQGLIIAESSIIYTDNDEILLPGETAKLKLTLTVGGVQEDHKHSPSKTTDTVDGSYNTDGIEDYKVDLNGAWVLSATQTTSADDNTSDN